MQLTATCSTGPSVLDSQNRSVTSAGSWHCGQLVMMIMVGPLAPMGRAPTALVACQDSASRTAPDTCGGARAGRNVDLSCVTRHHVRHGERERADRAATGRARPVRAGPAGAAAALRAGTGP